MAIVASFKLAPASAVVLSIVIWLPVPPLRPSTRVAELPPDVKLVSVAVGDAGSIGILSPVVLWLLRQALYK